jgi:glucosamine kinase
MPAFVGIDVGGTGSRFVLVSPDGVERDRGIAPGATGHLFNPDARRHFLATLAAIAQAIGGQGVIGAHAGITGLATNLRQEAQGLIAEAFNCPPERVTASDDMELAFRARFAPGEGHLVSAGTGSVGLHIRADGTPVRVGGRGILIDDAGAGAWLALRALDAVYRRIDETGGPADAERLAGALFAAIGGDDWDSVRAYVYAGDRGRIGALAPAVAEAALAGDPVATNLVEAAGHEIARLATALIAREGPAPVDFIGGVLNIHPAIKPAIAAALPSARIGFPTLDAASAAARIARELASR